MILRCIDWKPLSLSACLLAAAWIAPAQSFDATNLQRPTTLDMPILFRAGDDLSWARPDLDDSKWMVVDPKRSLKDYFPNGPPADVAWYRLHIKVSPAQSGLALEEQNLASAFEIYLNGRRLLVNGRFAPYTAYTNGADIITQVPGQEIASGSLTLALRVHISKVDWRDSNPGLASGNLVLGEQSTLRDRFWREWLGDNTPGYLGFVLGLCLGFVALALFTAQRERTEYLWLFLSVILIGPPLMVLESLTAVHNLPLWVEAAGLCEVPLAKITIVGLGLAFLRIKVHLRIKVVIGAAVLLEAVGLGGGTLQWFGAPVLYALELPLLLILWIGFPIAFLLHFRRGDREAGILLIPWLLFSVDFLFGQVLVWTALIPSLRHTSTRIYLAVYDSHLGPFQLDFQGVVNCLWAISWGLILVWRTIRLSREQERLEGELEAARQVQQVILPEENYSVPGFSVETVYKPAQQVGGDFFQVLPTSDGGLLLVLGDVAGKGMPAAMLVAVLVGAVRTLARFTSEPAEILAELNVRLLGRTNGGFSTCLAALIHTDGGVKLANAGQLAPYLNGCEVETPGALPLGILPDQVYETCSFHLEPGSRLTFYSDGIVEAQNQQGELLGFELGRELAMRPAHEIAAAASDFGQHDDITVVTIERQPVPEGAARAIPATGHLPLAASLLKPA